MKKAKFVQDAKTDPSRFYRNPTDIVRDRRLTDDDRKDILDAWEREMLSGGGIEDDASEEKIERLEQIRRARDMLDRNLDAVAPHNLTNAPSN